MGHNLPFGIWQCNRGWAELTPCWTASLLLCLYILLPGPSYCFLLPGPGNHQSAFCLPCLDISYKWNQTICGTSCLTSFLWHNVFKIHLGGLIYQFFIPVYGWIILRFMDRPRRRQWRPTPVFLPGKSHGWRSLEGCSPWVTEGWTQLSDFTFTFTFHFHALEKEMASHSSVLAWRVPGTGEPGGLPSVGSHRVGHDWSDSAAAAWIGHICVSIHSWMDIGLLLFFVCCV